MIIPVILSGGSGTRLWPVSRASYPKQFCEFYDRSFLSNTTRRLKTLGDVHILTTQDMDSLTRRAVKQEGLKDENVILEPMGKNTAPAVALLCHILQMRGQSQEIVGVFPSDHLIADEDAFFQAVALAETVARSGFVTTIGIQPHRPDTGYGYIEVSPESVGERAALKAMKVKGFREKPDLKTAQTYLRQGNYFWNAGMFVFQVAQMIEAFQKYQPRLWDKISQIDAGLKNAGYNYALVESISLDYAVMEKLPAQACVPCDMGWSDVGSWDEVARLAEESAKLGTRSQATIFNQDSENNFVYSVRDKVVGLVGVSDLLVIETPDALLVAHKGQSQKVKELVDDMRQSGQVEATEHKFESRPWGGFEILADEKEFKTKRLTVDPGARLSYQSHQHRSEHWVVIQGRAEVTLNEKVIALNPGQSIDIPVGAKHRVSNPGAAPLILVEIQTGTYFGEDDITRYKDDYNRVGK